MPVDQHTATSMMTEGDIMVLMYELFNRQESGHSGAIESTGQVYLLPITITVDYNYVGRALLCDVYNVAVGGVYSSSGGMKGAEERLVIKNGHGAATIHNDKLVVTVSVQGVVRQWSAGWSFARGTSVCKQFGFV